VRPLDGVHQQEMVHTMKTVAGIAGTHRRQHERSFKAELVAQCLVPGASVAAVALAGGVNANLLFKWRRDHLRAMRASGAAAASSAALVPVQVAPDMDSGSQLLPPASPATAVPGSRPTRNAGVIELDIGGVQLRLRGPVDEASLRSVLRALRNSP
jgi:transposase